MPYFLFLSVDTLIRGKSSGERNIALIDDLSYVCKAANKLQDLLDVVLNYVDEVIVSIWFPLDPHPPLVSSSTRERTTRKML